MSDEFAAVTERHRRELLVHCHQMSEVVDVVHQELRGLEVRVPPNAEIDISGICTRSTVSGGV